MHPETKSCQPEKLPRLALLALAWERREMGWMSTKVRNKFGLKSDSGTWIWEPALRR